MVCLKISADRPNQPFPSQTVAQANIPVGAKHYGNKSLLVTHKLSAVMLRPYTDRDTPDSEADRSPSPAFSQSHAA